jgi:hypothetical protein
MATATPLTNDHRDHGHKHSHRWIRVSVAVVAAIAVLAIVVVGVAALEVTHSVLVIPKTEAGSSPAPTFPAPPATQMATLTTLAEFPAKSFVENLAVRGDGSVLVTEETKHELWYLPAPSAGGRGANEVANLSASTRAPLQREALGVDQSSDGSRRSPPPTVPALELQLGGRMRATGASVSV